MFEDGCPVIGNDYLSRRSLDLGGSVSQGGDIWKLVLLDPPSCPFLLVPNSFVQRQTQLYQCQLDGHDVVKKLLTFSGVDI